MRDHEDAVEADLSRYHGIDYRDRWRPGRRRFTLRRIAVLLRFLPADAATSLVAGSSGWSRSDYLLAHLFHATTGKPHPALPKPQRTGIDPSRRRAFEAAKRRARGRAERRASP